MKEEKKNPVDCESRIAKEYDNYFTALNTLVNSTMHNERQFVQATAFNAVFYSVPPKIMAFYNAYIYRIKQILRDMGCEEEYTFLIYPSFSPSISVEEISLDDNLPVDRLLTVRISEKSLYDIESVMYQMVHELAHYVGNDLRCRVKRRQKIMETLVKYIVAECDMDQESYQALITCVNKHIVLYNDECHGNEKKRPDYLKYMNYEGRRLIQMLEYDQNRQRLLEEYYREKFDKKEFFCDELLEKIGIEDVSQKIYFANRLPQYCTVKSMELYGKLKHFDSEKDMDEYDQYIELMKSAYSESYADLQMILVLAMDAEEYLSTFLIKQNMPRAAMLSDDELMLRISTIYRVMEDSGIWKRAIYSQESGFAEIIECIEMYNHEIREEMQIEENIECKVNIQSIKKHLENMILRMEFNSNNLT